MEPLGPYIWCIVKDDQITPLGVGKSLKYAKELGKEAYSMVSGEVKLFELVEVQDAK